MLVIDSESTTKIEQNQEPIIGAAVKAQLEQTNRHMSTDPLLAVDGKTAVDPKS